MSNETKPFFLTARFCDQTAQFLPSAALVDCARKLAEATPDGVVDFGAVWEKLDHRHANGEVEALTREALHFVRVPLESGKTFAAQVTATLKAHEKSEAKKAKATK